jgi:allophanate hydrolase subunit 2
MATLTVVRPGMLTTIQDLGRWGSQDEGVPVAGPMDAWSHRHANRLVGNPDSAAAIEVTLIGPELESDADVVCAVSGARFEIAVNGAPVSMYTAFVLPARGRLRFGNRLAGARATLAVHGGIDVPSVFGSRATSLISRLGPFGGRPLAAGAALPVG